MEEINQNQKTLVFCANQLHALAVRDLINQMKIFSRYIGKQQEFLDFVLEQYIKVGVGELDRSKLPQLLELKYHTVRDAVGELGSVANISEVFIGFQQYLYSQKIAA